MAADWKAGRADERPELWFTYHLYYKAPDWLGPAVSEALGIPYVIAEASYAPKRAHGPWAFGHEGSAAAIRKAALVLDRKSTRLNSSHQIISYAVFCLKKKIFGPGSTLSW